MKERPILFSGPMVRAILDGRKRVTRRVVSRLRVRLRRSVWSDSPIYAKAGIYRAVMNPHGAVSIVLGDLGVKPGEFDFVCPYVDGETHLGDYDDQKKWTIVPSGGQRLWVRETWGGDSMCGVAYRADHPDWERFRGDGEQPDSPWRPSIFMPRWASRLTLEVYALRLERLQEITADDVLAEGIEVRDRLNAVRDFATVWDQLNGKRAPWASAPWVWVISFRRVEAMERAA